MFLSDMLTKNIILWGTGKMSEEFFSEWETYAKVWESIAKEPFPSVRCVWDSDPAKQGTCFHGLEITKPLETTTVDDYCIIAVSRCASIVKELELAGYRKDSGFKLWRKFLDDVRRDMAENIEGVLADLTKRKILSISANDMKTIFHSSYDEAGIGVSIYNEIEKSLLNADEKAVLGDMLWGYVLKRRMEYGWNGIKFSNLPKNIPLSGIISGAAMVFARDVQRLVSFLDEDIFSNNKKTSIKTIGIYDLRYQNGGEQRVLSLLLPMYVSLGYQVVLLTDERGEKEYPLPDGVVRIVLKHKSLTGLKLRLEEFRHYIQKYNIDIMCFHYIKDDINLFYETLYLKLLGVSVIAEIHIMFLMLIRKRNYAAKLWAYTFRLMDRVVVLSRHNALFWQNLGCRALYIPNPVDGGQLLWNRPIPFDKRKGMKILWIGRTTDYGKHLEDAVRIMENVVKAVPDAKLRIVGETGGLSRLRNIIADNHLENNIEFCGYHTDVSSFYGEADVMLMTSEMEGFPMILVESKLYGVPTVMYELPYLELVRDERGVLSVPQRDVEAAAQALIRILLDDTMRHRMSIDAKRSIYPFINYDIASAWKKVFDEISSPTETFGYNSEQRVVQELLMQEIWKEEE